MRFYRLYMVLSEKNAKKSDDFRQGNEFFSGCKSVCAGFSDKHKDSYFFAGELISETLICGIISEQRDGLEDDVLKLIELIDPDCVDFELEEATFGSIERLLGDNYSRHGRNQAVLERFDLDKMDYFECRDFVRISESLIEDTAKSDIYEQADKLLTKNDLKSELDRIYASPQCPGLGHPVHYLMRTDDDGLAEENSRLLLEALYQNKRVENRRYCKLSVKPHRLSFGRTETVNAEYLDKLFRSLTGGAVIIEYSQDEEDDGNYANGCRENIERICRALKKYQNRVLAIIRLPRECENIKEMFFENLGNISFIELSESFAYEEESRDYLNAMAVGNGVSPNAELYANIEPGRGYLTGELNALYEDWHSNDLKENVYPQYKDIASIKYNALKSEPIGCAYDELMNMPGLKSAKEVIRKALNYYKAQKVFADKGMKADKNSMHMVFSGNPGTAKTTVARLFSRIMRDNGVLSTGAFVETGRADLVGKYVGWTAPTVQKKFKEARGGVLLIDEAYSLIDDRSNSYGDEAINAIVQEMENRRGEVVVIFAGYTEQMEYFLERNPGLKSRIAFQVPFDDYNSEELCDIAELIAAEKGLDITPEARAKMAEIFDSAITEKDFGNGRYARNIIENARMCQAQRLLGLDIDSVTKSDVTTLLDCDIEIPKTIKTVKRTIGFRG